jgi:O-antigen/teichoic acid export membrane protein
MTVVSTSIIISVLGADGFGVFGVITGLYTMLSVVEVASAVGVNTMLSEAEELDDPDASRRVLASALWLMRRFSAVALVVAVVASLVLPWTTLTGSSGTFPAAEVSLAVLVYLVLFVASLPWGPYQRALDGLRRSPLNALFVLAVPGLLFVVALLTRHDHPALAVFTAAAAAGSVVHGLLARTAVRRIGGGRFKVRRGDVDRSVAAEVWHRSWPMTIIAAASTVAYSLDPMVVASALTSSGAAEYVLGAKMAALVTIAITAPTPVLWNYFAGRRARTGVPVLRGQLVRMTALWVAVAVGLAVVLVAVGPAFASWWSHGQIEVSRGLMVAFGVLLVVSALQYPTATVLNDPASLRFQAVTMTAMAVVNLALSLWLVRVVGVAGPVIASCLALFFVQVVPVMLRARRLIPA